MLQKGIYLVSLASMILGTPDRVSALALTGATGVDEHCGILLGYSTMKFASLVCSVRIQSQRTATVLGSAGEIHIHAPITCPGSLTLRSFPSRRMEDPPRAALRQSGIKALMIRHGKNIPAIRRLRERYSSWSERLLYGIHTSPIFAPPAGEGFHYQASEVVRCLRAGKLESEIMPLNESLSIMQTMDRIREQIANR